MGQICLSALLHCILNAPFKIDDIILYSSPWKLNHSGLFTPGQYLKVREKPENGVELLANAAVPPQTNEMQPSASDGEGEEGRLSAGASQPTAQW